MPNIKSAVKRMRQNRKGRLNNRRDMSRMRTQLKKFRGLLDEEKVEEARALLPQVYSVIDKTSQSGVIHSNTAARYKSRLARHLQRQVS